MEEKKHVIILDDFEGSMIGKYQVENNKIFINLKKEKPTFGFRNKKFDYNLHFHFGLYNSCNEEKTVEIFIECRDKKRLNGRLTRLWLSNNFDKEYELVENVIGKTNFHGKYHFKLHLVKKQKLYLANYPPKKYSTLKKTLQNLSDKSNAKEVIIGRTVENRSIIAYEFGNIDNNPTILFVAGFHPPERDTLAIEAIMDKFQNTEWKENVFQNYSFSFIPILNPDGFANAMQGSNINEINFHWKFFGNTKDKCPEAYYIWKYCSKIKPIIFFDFHSFTFQNNTARPYLIPERYYVGKKARHIQNYLNNKLKELCGQNYSKNESILAPNLLATKLRNEFGTITVPKFHLHMKDGIEESKKMAIHCLEIVLSILYRCKVNSKAEILKKPHGKIKYHIYDRIRIKLLDLWFFKIKIFIKKILIR